MPEHPQRGTSNSPVWLLWGRREGGQAVLFGIYADRETALAAEDAAKVLPRAPDWADIWVSPWEARTTPKLRAAVAYQLQLNRVPAVVSDD